MSEKDPIRVFVAHRFTEDTDYQRVFEYLESRDNFFYVNCSDPDGMPGGGGAEAIKAALLKQMKPAELLVLPVTMYEHNQELARFQMDAAQAAGIPILAVQSFGSTVAIQKEVLERASDVVEWDDRVITNAIKKLARNEDPTQWEVIDFTLD